MTNYRTFSVLTLTSGQTASVNISGSSEQRVWGVLRGASGAGSIVLEGGGTVSIADLAVGYAFPCHPTFISASAGNVYILS